MGKAHAAKMVWIAAHAGIGREAADEPADPKVFFV